MIIDDIMTSAERQLRNFSQILEKITTIDDKKKQLWLEIYSNAIEDRQRAFAVFKTLNAIAQNSTSEWAVHGRTVASLIERMSKSNDQLVKLADLIARAEDASGKINSDDVFDMIKGN